MKKKFLSVILAGLLAVSMCVPVTASDTVSSNGSEDVTPATEEITEEDPGTEETKPEEKQDETIAEKMPESTKTEAEAKEEKQIQLSAESATDSEEKMDDKDSKQDPVQSEEKTAPEEPEASKAAQDEVKSEEKPDAVKTGTEKDSTEKADAEKDDAAVKKAEADKKEPSGASVSENLITKETEEIKEEKEDKEKLEQKELEIEADGYKITASGELPDDVHLYARRFNHTEQEGVAKEVEDALSDAITSVTVYEAFDIQLRDESDKVWQPVEHKSRVDIRIEGLKDAIDNVSEKEHSSVAVHRINEDTGEIDTMPLETEGDAVSFSTEHFIVYVVDGVSYNTSGAVRPIYSDGEYSDEWGVDGLDMSEDQDGSIRAFFFPEEKTILVTGFGRIKDYSSSYLPWHHYYYTTTDGPVTDSVRIGKYAKKLIISDGITHIGKYAFNELGTEELVIPDSVTEISDFAFGFALDGSAESELTLPDNLVSIGQQAFETNDRAIVKINAGNHIEEIGVVAFRVVKQNITDDVETEIETTGYPVALAAYDWETANRIVSLPISVNSSDYDAAEALNAWDVSEGTDGSVAAYWFGSDKPLVIAGSGSMKDYSEAEPSPLTANKGAFGTGFECEADTRLQRIGNYAFKGLDGMTGVVLPSNYSIGSHAFEGCSALADIDMGQARFGTDASGLFKDCSMLANLDLSEANLSDVMDASSMLQGCSSLEELDLSGQTLSGIAVADDMLTGSGLKKIALPAAIGAEVTLPRQMQLKRGSSWDYDNSYSSMTGEICGASNTLTVVEDDYTFTLPATLEMSTVSFDDDKKEYSGAARFTMSGSRLEDKNVVVSNFDLVNGDSTVTADCAVDAIPRDWDVDGDDYEAFMTLSFVPEKSGVYEGNISVKLE